MTRKLFLGATVEPSSGDRAGMLHYSADDLTTHAVIVGMTGSGKTGLGVVLLEELLRAGVPALVIDPKGDMGNLQLTFPELRPRDFEPWIEDEAGKTRDQVASDRAESWRKGLDSWQLGTDELTALRAAADVTIYTPGSTAGVPLNVLGSFDAPAIDWEVGAESARDEIQGLISGLLQLVDIDSDPLTSREHILLSNLVERSWREGKDLDLAQLLQQIQSPPMRKLGVFELDTFFPAKDRQALALRLNGLLATPSFASWIEGAPVNIAELLWTPEGSPRAAVVYLAHLSETERQFVVTLLMSKVATWMQTQSGSSKLRAVVYMDEVFGFLPPTSVPPSKKPILTLLKQARAFGVGVILATQNPVDLDYKAMSNAGTWMIGRLQTERDKARILEALKSASGRSESRDIDAILSNLEKRHFLLHSARSDEPTLFTTRWAMSYLAGPLTKPQLGMLRRDPVGGPPVGGPPVGGPPVGGPPVGGPPVGGPPVGGPPVGGPPVGGPPVGGPPVARASETLRDDESPIAPTIAEDVPVYYMDPAAPWAPEVRAARSGNRYKPAISARVRMTFDERKAKLDHSIEWEAIFTDLTDPFDPSGGITVDHDRRDFRSAPASEQSVYRVATAPLGKKSYFKAVHKSLRDWLHQNEEIELFHNAELKLYSFVGETREAFAARCAAAASDVADTKAAAMRDKLEKKVRTLQRKMEQAERRKEDAEDRASDSKRDEVISGVGSVVGVLLGRRSASSIAGRSASSARRASSGRTRSARLARKAKEYGDKIEDIQEEMTDLEQDTTDEVTEIVDEWADKAEAIESMNVGLERDDISIEQIALVWIPIGD